jgi:hypothetical protein
VPKIIAVIKPNLRWTVHVACKQGNCYTPYLEKSEEGKLTGRDKLRWEDNIKIYIK